MHCKCLYCYHCYCMNIQLTSLCVPLFSYMIKISGNVFFNPIPSHSQWFIPIPTFRFNLVLLPFLPILIGYSHSPRSHSHTASSISSDNKWAVNSTMHGTVYCYKKKKTSTKSSKNTHAVSAQSEARAHPEWNPTVYDKLLCKSKGPLIVSDDRLSVGWIWKM